MKNRTIHELDPEKVKIFIHRERNEQEFEAIKATIAERGQLHPGQVRDIRHLPKEERRREDGGLYDYGLITGEGRLRAARELGRKFRATIEDVKEAKVVGYFLAENLNREPLPWALKARLVGPELEAGKSAKEIAGRLQITEKHVLKFARILSKVAPEVAEDVSRMSMNDAEVITALPKADQLIVLDVMKETGEREIQTIVRKARQVAEKEGGLSKTALKGQLDQVDHDLAELRKELKPVRLHHSIGPENLQALLQDKKFKATLKKEGINFTKFERLTEV